ncbi:HD-GYP domain-containing protein [Catenulispora subtropica]|uniref:HD-GYP domain-containing protein n=1 Tax=Catenulispora subtropica TaxID=450798 RepID=A0ABP5D0R1_9ACTN
MPFSLRCYIFTLLAAAAATIALLPLSRTKPVLLLALCALVVAAERISRVKIGVSGWTMSISLVVTLITVLVLAPPAAALVGLVTSLSTPPAATTTWIKRTVNAAMLSLVPASGAAVCYLTGGHDQGHFLGFPGFLWPVFASVTTCLLVNELIVAGFLALSSHARFLDVLRGDLKRATMPYYSSAVLALIFLALWNDIGWYTTPLVVVPMYIAHWSLLQYAQEEAAHEGTIAALVQAVEIKDSYTRGHSERVARGAEMLARQLKMPQERVVMLRFAGLLHDIGKLGVPTRLLTSTGGLTEDEFKLLCMHPNHGVAVLRDIRFLTEVYEGVLYHHERLDGRGYPTGKSGDEIPEFARIIGVADAFDAMTSTRSYRAARSVEEAVAELRRGAGTQFDPALVRTFEEALALAERAGRPWVPTELAPAEPPADETAAVPTGPWPLPKRVPGFSFADHDDPFVPAEWFSDWFPSWLSEAWEGSGPEPPYAGRPQIGPGGGIPGPRSAEPLEAVPRVEGEAGPEPDVRPAAGSAASAGSAGTDGPDAAGAVGSAGGSIADFDDGWSARMHSAVVREPAPEPDEGPPEPFGGLTLRLRDVSLGVPAEEGTVEPCTIPGSMRIRGADPRSARPEAERPVPEDGAAASADGGASWFERGPVTDPAADGPDPIGSGLGDPAGPGSADPAGPRDPQGSEGSAA